MQQVWQNGGEPFRPPRETESDIADTREVPHLQHSSRQPVFAPTYYATAFFVGIQSNALGRFISLNSRDGKRH